MQLLRSWLISGRKPLSRQVDALQTMEDWEKELEGTAIVQPIIRYGVKYCPYDEKKLDFDTIGYFCGEGDSPFSEPGSCNYRILYEMLNGEDEMGDEDTWDATPERHIMIVDCRNRRYTLIGGTEEDRKQLKEIFERVYGVDQMVES